VVLRANLDPKVVESGSTDQLLKSARALVALRGTSEYFVLATGVVPYWTPREKLQALARFARECIG
jgi:hypothetical protein